VHELCSAAIEQATRNLEAIEVRRAEALAKLDWIQAQIERLAGRLQ
jgi:hypothetical protein